MAKLVIDANRKLSKINKEIQGQFSEHLGRCIYEGLYVGENSDIPNVNGMRTDVVEALKNIKVPVLRWPGGCFADEYHWKDGIGPKESRKKMNVSTKWLCPKCGNSNPANIRYCSNCSCQKPNFEPISAQTDVWQCPKCGKINQNYVGTCGCGTRKP